MQCAVEYLWRILVSSFSSILGICRVSSVLWHADAQLNRNTTQQKCNAPVGVALRYAGGRRAVLCVVVL